MFERIGKEKVKQGIENLRVKFWVYAQFVEILANSNEVKILSLLDVCHFKIFEFGATMIRRSAFEVTVPVVMLALLDHRVCLLNAGKAGTIRKLMLAYIFH